MTRTSRIILPLLSGRWHEAARPIFCGLRAIKAIDRTARHIMSDLDWRRKSGDIDSQMYTGVGGVEQIAIRQHLPSRFICANMPTRC
jgi:hypothetical protein